ncbi:radical SAM domain-containing protein [Klebsiella pneumoniae subsp. pneumoniae]|nr:radical SAM domain-containing protein [Klebsiella pneumoniae subsp. pneumoniae]
MTPIPHPYGEDLPCADNKPVAPKKQEAKSITVQPPRPKPWEKTYVLLPSFEKVKGDKVLYAHASRILPPRNQPRLRPGADAKARRALHLDQPAAIPLSTEEMDSVFALPYKRVPHPSYAMRVFRRMR